MKLQKIVFSSLALVLTSLTTSAVAQAQPGNPPPRDGFDQLRITLSRCEITRSPITCVGSVVVDGLSMLYQKLTQIEYQIQNQSSQPQPPMPPMVTKSISFHNQTDNCAGGVVAMMDFSGNIQQDEARCQTKAAAIGNVRVWSIRVNNTCYDISDNSFLAACMGQI